MKNTVDLIGRVGKDPEITQLQSGNIAKFTLATSEKWKDKAGEKKEETEWHNIVAYGHIVNVIEKFVKKGALLNIEGKIHYNQWEKDGVKHYRTDIICRGLLMLGDKQGASESSGMSHDEVGCDLPS
jgi:single-strand DNA-binding protein